MAKKKKTSDKIAVLIRLPPALIEKLDRVAEKENRSRTGQVESIINEYLRNLKE